MRRTSFSGFSSFSRSTFPLRCIASATGISRRSFADRFQIGRVFIIGDGAHRHTPFGGLGLNSGIQDAHNLCWKLALTLKGKASASLPETYEAERRPVVTRNAEWSLFALANHPTVMASMGIVAGAAPEFNEQMIKNLLADTLDGASRRARMNEVIETQRCEYGPHDLEMGFQYRQGALVDDETPWPTRDPMGADYTPSTRPGCRLAHAWLRAMNRRFLLMICCRWRILIAHRS